MCFHSPWGFVLALISLIVFPVKHSNCLYNQAAGTARICVRVCVLSMASINIHFSVRLSMCMRLCAVTAKHKRVFVIIRITARARSR